MTGMRTALIMGIGALVAGRSATAQGVVAVVDVRLIDGNGGPPLDHATVVVREGRITAVGPARTGGP